MTIEEELLQSSVGPQWSRIGAHHHHGIDIALSSLRTEKSAGIGEFYDLLPLVDWCKKIGMDVIQLLPLNDTGDDTSPFFAQSAMALNPLFISLHKLPGVTPKMLEELRRFNHLQRVAYHDVQSHKLLFLRTYFEEKGAKILQQKVFEEFVENNSWVESYALFKVLKDHMAKNSWQTWPKELQHLNQKKFDQLIKKYWVEVCFYVFLQFLAYEQLSHVKKYANKKGIFLKGDIPILISPDSADVWQYADEFDLTHSAGAPPDAYAKDGQVWGLPIFHWDVMKKRNYDWWKTRLDYATNFYDIYRIDHVLGFFRIWAIPQGQPSKNGQFIPPDRADWLPHGKEILAVLCDHTPMLPIAEDLGIVPSSVRSALSELGICGTRVIRWEKRKNQPEHFIDLLHYNPISMTTVSTHDSETLAQYWANPNDDAFSYAEYKGWNYTPKLSPAQRKEILWDSHHSSSLFHINLLGEYLALFPELIWENPKDERINVPGTVSPTNWTYRLRPTIEEIVHHEPLTSAMRDLIS